MSEENTGCAPFVCGGTLVREQYPAIYRDARGEEHTVIENDGRLLRMTVRGVPFVGNLFDDFEPEAGGPSKGLQDFSFLYGFLVDCTIECDMPIPVVAETEVFQAGLHVDLSKRSPMQGAQFGSEELNLRLDIGSTSFASKPGRDTFECALQDIQSALPPDIYLQCCFTCAFSDYDPAGNGVFGCLACFRDNKAGYLKIRGKNDLIHMWKSMTEYVQETSLCPEYRRRVPGAGYRG